MVQYNLVGKQLNHAEKESYFRKKIKSGQRTTNEYKVHKIFIQII